MKKDLPKSIFSKCTENPHLVLHGLLIKKTMFFLKKHDKVKSPKAY